MTAPSYDLAVIGGGSAGYAAARTGIERGLRTVVIDGAETLGGLCILRGCMPSKTLIESANRFRTLRRAEEFGLRAREIEVHPAEIRDRKRRLIGEFAEYRQDQLADGRFDLIRGAARFLDPHEIEITPRDPGADVPGRLHARCFILASGSVIQHPDLPGLEETGFLTSDDVLDSDTLPPSIVVLGGGAIALEMAHYFDGLGVRVSVIQRSPRVLKTMDSDVTGALETALRARGIDLICDTRLERVEAHGREKSVFFTHEGKLRSIAAAEILLALGRTPNTDTLCLDAAGVQSKRGRVVTNGHQQSSVDHIFAAGDVCGPHEVVHIAIEQGELAARNAAALIEQDTGRSGKPKDVTCLESIDYRLKLFGVFTEPQVAAAGLTEEEAREAGLDVRCALYPFDDHGKSIVLGETEGFVKLIARADSGEIVGSAAVGPEAVELIHETVVAMHFRSTVHDFVAIPHYHPTLSEIWTYPAEELAESITRPDS